ASLIANPNCTTAIAAVALWPIHQRYGIKRVIISTYQASSGAGAPGMEELENGVRAWTRGENAEAKTFQHPLHFNVIPHIDSFQDNGYTREEMKVAWETRKIFGAPDLLISCTAVRIPTFRAHAEAITIETIEPIDAAGARAALEAAAGVEVIDDPANNRYPMPLTASGKYAVEAGRIRANPVFGDHGLDLFVCGDQLLKGAALNAVQIAALRMT
ncbi:MAG: aspartate-semialdehyde dehydrogenase, partial [Myxococcota bacterium]